MQLSDGEQEGKGECRLKEVTSPLVENLTTVLNVIEVREIEQRSGLLRFNWVNLMANKNVKSKLKAALIE